MTAYATPDDVQTVLQESDAKFGSNELSTGNVTAALEAASSWFRNRSKAHFYDSTDTSGDLDTSTATATNIQYSVPSSPHRQSGQLHKVSDQGVSQRYPNTHTGRYCRVNLGFRFVDSIDKLEVRNLGGEVTDWVAEPEFSEGRGEDYYTVVRGPEARGRSYLYIHAPSLGAQLSFEDILSVDLSFGADYSSVGNVTEVRRGIAALAGAQLVADDDVLAGLPDGASVMGVDTEVQQLVNQAFGFGDSSGFLGPWLQTAVE
jgi:hypothetical protein